jgi:hypothetical protein
MMSERALALHAPAAASNDVLSKHMAGLLSVYPAAPSRSIPSANTLGSSCTTRRLLLFLPRPDALACLISLTLSISPAFTDSSSCAPITLCPSSAKRAFDNSSPAIGSCGLIAKAS